MLKKFIAKFIKPDPRIGKSAREKDGGFTGVITEITKLESGEEWFEIKSGASGAGGMSENFEILEDLEWEIK